MKKKKILSILVCALLVFSLTGCGVLSFLKPRTKGNMDSANADQTVSSDATSSSKEDSKADSTDDALATDEANGDESAGNMTDQELFDDFLKGHGEVHFDNYQPEKFYNYGEYMFAKGDSVTLDQLLGTYEQYYMQALTYTEPWRNISYTYIDAGDAGRKELVVECSFPGGTGAQFVMWAENGQLQMVYVMDSQERMYGTVANEYGLFTITNSQGYDYYDVQYKYLDENGEIHNVYTEYADYTFGQPTNMADPILDWAKEFKDEGKLTDSVVLRSYSFDEFQPDFTPEEEEKYFTGMLYTVECLNDWEPYHEDAMYEAGSVFSQIFEKAGRKLSTPEEIETEIEKAKKATGMPDKAMKETTMVLKDMTPAEVGAVFGADVNDGKSELEHAITAYSKFLTNRVNFCEMLTEQTISPYGNPEPGLVYGFALRDFTEDGVPELVVDFGQPAYPLMSKIYIYQYNDTDGAVKRMFKMEDAVLGDFGAKYLKDNMNESFLTARNEGFENIIDQCPDFADSLLNIKYQGPLMVGTSGRYLVTFDKGVEDDMWRTLMWYDFVEDNAQTYTEYLSYVNGNTDLFEYEVDESCVDDPEKVLDNFKPILFYDITDENIEKIITMDYWNKNSGAGAFSDYSDEDAYNYLSQKAEWYFDLGIMDDDDSYDSVNFYDYDEENDVSTTIFFDLDKLIQSHFRAERY